MAAILIPVRVLDEKCNGCKAMDLDKRDLYSGEDTIYTEYICSHLHLCTYIRNRIVRNEPAEKEEEEEE